MDVESSTWCRAGFISLLVRAVHPRSQPDDRVKRRRQRVSAPGQCSGGDRASHAALFVVPPLGGPDCLKAELRTAFCYSITPRFGKFSGTCKRTCVSSLPL